MICFDRFPRFCRRSAREAPHKLSQIAAALRHQREYFARPACGGTPLRNCFCAERSAAKLLSEDAERIAAKHC
jgi:hypothetical protein